jgi:glutamate dehydrogenase (NAD(P)+)
VIRPPYMTVTWHDPVTGRPGFLVIDRLIDGASGGGLRMREGCTVDEVADLARAMSLKEAVAYDPGDRYTPFGGAKGGIDCDPYDPDATGVLRRYVEAMRPFLERHWATGEDFGVRQDTLDEVFADAGLHSSIDAALLRLDDADAGLGRLRDGFAVDVDGIGLAEMVGGFGVAEAALAALERLGLVPGATRAVVQGFGSMGGATARYLARAGVRVVGIADRDGLVANPDGLDVERLLRARDAHGAIDRAALRPEDEQRDGADWLALDAELLVPAAMSYVIGVDDVPRVRARVIVEAANVATLPEAEPRLAGRGIVVVPDFVANLATNAWWWWTLYGDVPPERDPALAKVAATMRRLVGELLERAERESTLPRAAATAMAAENLARLAASSSSVK